MEGLAYTMPNKVSEFKKTMELGFSKLYVYLRGEFFIKRFFPFVLVYGIIITFLVHYTIGSIVPQFQFSFYKVPMIIAWGSIYYFIKMEFPEIILFCKR